MEKTPMPKFFNEWLANLTSEQVDEIADYLFTNPIEGIYYDIKMSLPWKGEN